MKRFSYVDNCIAAVLICSVFIFAWLYFKGVNYFNFIYSISFLIVCTVMMLFSYQVENVSLKAVKNFFKIDVAALYNFINSDASKFRVEECPRQLATTAQYSDSHMSSMCCNSNIGASIITFSPLYS